MTRLARLLSVAVAAVLLLVVAGCSPAPIAQGTSDPHEEANRRMHEANLRLDRAIFGQASDAAEEDPPGPLRKGISNFASNITLPALVVNKLLQGKLEDAAHNTARFVINTVMGFGGLFDPASDGGLEARGTDFGETLHVWGVPEGDYVVLPFFGPSTERDAAGRLVDFFTNPLSYRLPNRLSYVPVAADLASRASARVTHSATFDAIMYESADPYATARRYYLDSRRYSLGGDAGTDEDLYDIYEEDYD